MKQRVALLFTLALGIGLLLPVVQGQKKTTTDWPTFGNDAGAALFDAD